MYIYCIYNIYFILILNKNSKNLFCIVYGTLALLVMATDVYLASAEILKIVVSFFFFFIVLFFLLILFIPHDNQTKSLKKTDTKKIFK